MLESESSPLPLLSTLVPILRNGCYRLPPEQSYPCPSFPTLAELQLAQHVPDDFPWRLADAQQQRIARLLQIRKLPG